LIVDLFPKFLIKKHVIAVQARQKLTHAVGKIKNANMVLGAIKKNSDSEDEDERVRQSYLFVSFIPKSWPFLTLKLFKTV
jgi:hypothetical protein